MKSFGQIALGLLALLAQPALHAQNFPPPPDLYSAAIHTFGVLKSGVPICDPQTGVHHPASHIQDAILAGSGTHRDLSGGWYNAADYGKWTMMTAITVSYMLDLYSLQQRSGQSQKWPDPRLLEEARWGLTWMLKMQNSDGGVLYKVDGATKASLATAWGQPPELDPNVRIAAPATTGSTADFAAAMYQAAESFASIDSTGSNRFRAAADHAWAWLAEHPSIVAHDPFYADHDPAGELLWAEAEHALTYGLDSSKLARKMVTRLQPEVSSRDPSLLGIYRLASNRKSPPRMRRTAASVVLKRADDMATAAASHPFRVVLGKDDFSWGSAERVLQCAAFFLMADSLRHAARLHRAALDQLAWMLGNNAAQHSFITAFGRNPVLHPWHWIYRDYGIVLPGWAVLGPNGSPDGVDPALKRLQERGTEPARCYVDLCSNEGSWASNEGQISEESALVFVTGVLRLSTPLFSHLGLSANHKSAYPQ